MSPDLQDTEDHPEKEDDLGLEIQSPPEFVVGALRPEVEHQPMLSENGKLTPEGVRSELERFKISRVKTDFPGAEPGRCILRPAMVEIMINNRFDDPEDFFKKIPEYLRRSIDARQKRYLEDICEIVSRME